MPGNADAWNLWDRIRSSWRVGMGGAYALDLREVIAVAGVLGLEMTPGLLDAVQALADEQLAIWGEQHGQ